MTDQSAPRRMMWLSSLSERLFGGSAGGVFRHMATLVAGSGAARIITFAATPLLTRLYTPADMGVLAVFTALVALLAPLLTLRYVIAAPLPRGPGMALNVMALSGAVMVGMLLLIAGVFQAFGPAILGLLSMQALAGWEWLVLIGLAGTGIYEALSTWALRKRAYKVIARTQVVQAAMGAAVKVGLGYLGLKPLGLLVGQVAAQSGGSGSLLVGFLRDVRRHGRRVSLKRMALVARYYRGFPIYRLPSQFLLVLSLQAIPLYMAARFDTATAGQLGLAMTAVALPVTLIGGSVGQALYGEASRLGRRNAAQIQKLVVGSTRRLAVLALPPALLLMFLGPEIFTLAFGASWEKAGLFASILSIYLLFQLAGSPVVQVLNIFDGQSVLLQLNAQRVVLMGGVFLAAHNLHLGDVRTVAVYSVVISAHYAFTIWRVLTFLRGKAAPVPSK